MTLIFKNSVCWLFKKMIYAMAKLIESCIGIKTLGVIINNVLSYQQCICGKLLNSVSIGVS